MIGQRQVKQTLPEKHAAYELATLRDNDTCQMLGLHMGPVQRDHRQNRDPYNTVVENLVCLCLLHHAFKTEHPEWAYHEGWGVPRRANPANYPCRRTVDGRLTWVLLLPDIDYFDHLKGYREIGSSAARDLIENWEGVTA